MDNFGPLSTSPWPQGLLASRDFEIEKLQKNEAGWLEERETLLADISALHNKHRRATACAGRGG